MKTTAFVLLALSFSFNLHAYSNFIENPYTPYPPGCATLPELQSVLYGDNAVKVFEGEIPLPDAGDPTEKLPVNLAVYRVACADDNRSIIVLEFAIPARLDPAVTYYRVPAVGVNYDLPFFPSGTLMRLSEAPNDWGGTESDGSGEVFGGNTPNTTDGHDRRWLFIFDNLSPWALEAGAYPADYYMLPTYYNNYFTMYLGTVSESDYGIGVPSTASLLTANPRIPLSGRLSGNWVVDGASDQGFVIAISELVPEAVPSPEDLADSPLLMFLSWYTYDANGHKLWLTGSSQFGMGDTEVTIPIEKVTHGEFLGSKTAERAVVGSVTITGNNCNDLSFQYDLGDLGLGSGTKHLKRRFSLETAGYVCRDLEARMATR